METVIILGAGQFGRGAARLLNQENMALLAFGDNNPALHQLTESERTEKGFPANVPVLPVDEALSLKPDYIITGVTDRCVPASLRISPGIGIRRQISDAEPALPVF